MGRTLVGWMVLRRLAVHHGRLTVLGLVMVLVPIVIAAKSIEHAHKALHKAVQQVYPGIEMIGGISVAVIILLGLLLACWLLGGVVSRTRVGRRLFDWEEARFLARSPLLKSYVAKTSKKKAGEPPAPSEDPQPALAHVAGGWQPGVIVEEQADGWATVFLPDIPSVATGRLFCVHADQILRLDVSLDAFREKLTSTGHGSEYLLKALAEAKPDEVAGDA